MKTGLCGFVVMIVAFTMAFCVKINYDATETRRIKFKICEPLKTEIARCDKKCSNTADRKSVV